MPNRARTAASQRINPRGHRRVPGFGPANASAPALRCLALLLALLAACSGGPRSKTNGRAADRSGVRIVVITHGQSSDPFWSVVSNGVRDAAADLGVRAEYQAPTSFDMVRMSEMIDAAVASRPSGLVVSIPDAKALERSIRAAVAAGIPVISINAGDSAWQALGILAHVGQPEYGAGYGAGDRLARAGARHALCVNHEVGNASQDERCRGFADALAKAGGGSRVLAVNLADPDETQQRIASALAADQSVDALLTLGPNGADPALAALQRVGHPGKVRFATFDLTPRVLQAIQAGQIFFAIDQQQYLQGYLPVLLLTKYLETRTMPGGGQVIRTGPGFVTRENAGDVAALTARGIR
jgi:simple sugar transport system substrate-binding protein